MPEYEVTLMMHVPLITHLTADNQDEANDKADNLNRRYMMANLDYLDMDEMKIDYVDDVVEI